MKIIYFRSDFVVPILHTTNKGINQIKLKKESFKTFKGLKMSNTCSLNILFTTNDDTCTIYIYMIA